MMQLSIASIVHSPGAGQMAHRHLLQFAMCAGVGVASGQSSTATEGQASRSECKVGIYIYKPLFEDSEMNRMKEDEYDRFHRLRKQAAEITIRAKQAANLGPNMIEIPAEGIRAKEQTQVERLPSQPDGVRRT